jgi:uncharacterized protein YbjT (DUF2867 family)
MTILIAGGTGTLGSEVVRLLAARDEQVRILTRDPDHAKHLPDGRVEVAAGDVRDPDAVARAAAGARTVVSAIHGFTGTGRDSLRAVDVEGNRNLIRAAEAGGAGHFVLLSVQGAAPDHPMELFRRKYEAEQLLRASTLAWTIIRPTAYMETWAKIVGEPLIETGKTTVFGRGMNPINFVSVVDVARFVERAATDPAPRGEVVEVGGPEDLTMREVAQTFARVTGKQGTVKGVPLPLMRAMAVLLRPVKPGIARQIQAGVVMDTREMRFDAAGTAARYPAIPQTRLEELVRRDYSRAD